MKNYFLNSWKQVYLFAWSGSINSQEEQFLISSTNGKTDKNTYYYYYWSVLCYRPHFSFLLYFKKIKMCGYLFKKETRFPCHCSVQRVLQTVKSPWLSSQDSLECVSGGKSLLLFSGEDFFGLHPYVVKSRGVLPSFASWLVGFKDTPPF